MTVYEQAVRENIPPPGYDVHVYDDGEAMWEAGKHVGRARMSGYHTRRAACLAAWGHFDEHGAGDCG